MRTFIVKKFFNSFSHLTATTKNFGFAAEPLPLKENLPYFACQNAPDNGLRRVFRCIPARNRTWISPSNDAVLTIRRLKHWTPEDAALRGYSRPRSYFATHAFSRRIKRFCFSESVHCYRTYNRFRTSISGELSPAAYPICPYKSYKSFCTLVPQSGLEPELPA